jgi:squalene-hopene/tetraprenyl-beta-curcumene cyclase
VTPAPGRADVSLADARAAVANARGYLLGQQDPAGYWPFDQPTGVAAAAEDLLFREFTGRREAGLLSATARWLRSVQLRGGGWAARSGCPADPSASVLAYCALRLAGDPADAYHMALAAGWIRDAGGLARAGIRAVAWLAMFGQARWDELRVPPPETVYLPARFPAGMPGWGRATMVPLAVIAALRPSRPLPFGLTELRVPAVGASQRPVTGSGHAPERQVPAGSARAAALRRCAETITASQQPDGSWCADGPGWHWSLIALHLLGIPAEHPAYAAGLAALSAHSVWTPTADGAARRLDTGEYAVTGTAGAVQAVCAAGLPAGHDALLAAGHWLLAREPQGRSRRLAGWRAGTGSSPGDWAAVLLALRRSGLAADAGGRLAAVRCARWLDSVQDRSGGWSDPSSGQQQTGPSAALTGEVLAALAAGGQPGSPPIRRAVVCLLRMQLPDGSWPAEHGTGELRATCAVLPALVAAGVLQAKSPVRRAAGWVCAQQNSDGGWAPAGGAGAASVPSATAAAMLALQVAGPDCATAIRRGASWLIRAQNPDGSWADAFDPVLAASLPVRALAGCVAGPAEADEYEAALAEDLAG